MATHEQVEADRKALGRVRVQAVQVMGKALRIHSNVG